MDRAVISTLNEHDVVFANGRGSYYNKHPGNQHYRQLVLANLSNYSKLTSHEKTHRQSMVYDGVTNRGGRFLEILNQCPECFDKKTNKCRKCQSTKTCNFFEPLKTAVDEKIKQSFRNTGKQHKKIY